MIENVVDVLSSEREIGPKVRERNEAGWRLIGPVTVATGSMYIQYVLSWEIG